MIHTKTRCYTKRHSTLGIFLASFSPWAFALFTSLGIHRTLSRNTYFAQYPHSVLQNYTFLRNHFYFFLEKYPESCCTSYPFELSEFLGAVGGISSLPTSEISLNETFVFFF